MCGCCVALAYWIMLRTILRSRKQKHSKIESLLCIVVLVGETHRRNMPVNRELHLFCVEDERGSSNFFSSAHFSKITFFSFKASSFFFMCLLKSTFFPLLIPVVFICIDSSPMISIRHGLERSCLTCMRSHRPTTLMK